LQKRLRKFYGSQHIDVAEEHFTSRIEPVYEEGVETSNDTLILFGTDFLGMQAMKKMFSPKTGSFKEIYLNPSNIMLQYSSPAEANEVIIKNLKPDSQTRFKIEEESEQVRRFPKTPKGTNQFMLRVDRAQSLHLSFLLQRRNRISRLL
jgi:hypothetical protein